MCELASVASHTHVGHMVLVFLERSWLWHGKKEVKQYSGSHSANVQKEGGLGVGSFVGSQRASVCAFSVNKSGVLLLNNKWIKKPKTKHSSSGSKRNQSAERFLSTDVWREAGASYLPVILFTEHWLFFLFLFGPLSHLRERKHMK